MRSEVARQQAEAEELTLLVAKSKTGYFGVCLTNPGYPKPYQARVWRGGKDLRLGSFATAEEAALCIARSPEGQAAAGAAAERAAELAAAPPVKRKARHSQQCERLAKNMKESGLSEEELAQRQQGLF